MTLNEAAQKFGLAGLDPSVIHKQEGAFAACRSFLQDISQTKGQNRRHHSGSLKHLVERSYHDHIYEGTFILAAVSMGFTPAFSCDGSRATFNISERDLARRAREYSPERLTEQWSHRHPAY
jgi:hypothetical protein